MITCEWSLAIRIRGRKVVAWPVGTTNAGDHQNDGQQDYHADNDPGYFNPTWHAGVGGRRNHLRLPGGIGLALALNEKTEHCV